MQASAEMEIPGVERYLRTRLGDNTLKVQKLSRSPMGLSRETWFVTLQDRRLVLRCDLPGGISAVPVSLRFEYEVYQRLVDTDVPVARVLWFEDDPEALGRLLYVREMIDGDIAVVNFDNPDPRYDELRIAVSKEHARKMALVHRLDWKKLGFDDIMTAPRDRESCGVATVDRLEAQYNSFPFPPSPLVTRAFRWMREHAPRNASTVCLCKGSNGAMQEIWRGGEIVGMSDWELASIGDPANDWARCQGFVPVVAGQWDEQRLLDYYESVSGLHVERASLDFYRLVYALEMLIVAHHAGLPILRGLSKDARLSYLATGPVHLFHLRLAQAMGLHS